MSKKIRDDELIDVRRNLSVVGHCCCGSPIYGPTLIRADEDIVLRFTCDCRKNLPASGEVSRIGDVDGMVK